MSPVHVVLVLWLTSWLVTLLVPSLLMCDAACPKGRAPSGKALFWVLGLEVVAAAGQWEALGAVCGTSSGRRAEAP